MKLSIIIPIYFEEKNIIKALWEIEKKVKTSHEIVLIYDIEKDPTKNIVIDYIKKNNLNNIRLIKNSIGTRQGVINAIKTGIKQAKGKVIVIMMADLSDDISQIDMMFELTEKDYDIICASRYMPGGKKIGGPWLKTLLSRSAGWTLHNLFNIPTHDATNAFKMYRKRIFENINIRSTGGFEYSLEIIIKAYKKGYKIIEIPTVWKDREKGKSNFKLLKWLPKYISCYLNVFK